MTPPARIGILGSGFSLGSVVRGNDDPVFRWLRTHPPKDSDLFEGLKYRRVLGPEQTVVSISVDAADQALSDAGITAQDVDMVLGVVSVGEYDAPSALSRVHAELGLPDRCRVVALNTEYTGFLDGAKLANDLIQAGSIGTALVVAGINWTAHMDYHQAVAVAASDGAGAAVIGTTHDATTFALVDWDNETDTGLYGALTIGPRPAGPPRGAERNEQLYTHAVYRVDPSRGADAIRTFGLSVPPMVVNRLLTRHGLRGCDVTLIAHQVSRPIQEIWRERVQPAAYISTLDECADMVSATVPVNLAMCHAQIETDLLVLLGVGMGMHATALLYARNR